MPKNKTGRRNKSQQKQRHNDRARAIRDLVSLIGIKEPKGTTIGSIGIVIKDLGLSHLAIYMSKSINNICENYLWNDMYILVYDDQKPCATMLCPVFNITEMRHSPGTIISTCVEGCIEALNKGASNIIYYMFDLDWTTKTYIEYEQIYAAINDTTVTVVTRNIDYANIVRDQFDVEAFVLQDECNIGTMLRWGE